MGRRRANQIPYIKAVLKANMVEALSSGIASYVPAFFMFVQNLMFMMIWVLFFKYADNLYGWTLREMMVLTAVICTAFGLTSVLIGGGYILNQMIDNGTLDKYLCRPGSVLVSAIFSNSRVAGFGDILTGLVLMAFVARFDLVEWVFFILSVSLVMVVFGAMVVIIQCLGFWKTNSASLSDSLFEFLIILSSQPQHGFPTPAKIIIFTLFPVGFMGLLPVLIFTQQSFVLLLPLLLAAIVFAFMARTMFYKGLERYKSGNMIG